MPMDARQEPVRRRSALLWLMQKRWRMTRSLTLGGQVCVIDAQERVLLVRHGYRPGWHFPGGGVEIGEVVADAARRELEEETGVVARSPLLLHGIFDNGKVFPGDHVILYVLRTFERPHIPAANYEIAEQDFYLPSALPATTTAPTRRRLAEIFEAAPVQPYW